MLLGLVTGIILLLLDGFASAAGPFSGNPRFRGLEVPRVRGLLAACFRGWLAAGLEDSRYVGGLIRRMFLDSVRCKLRNHGLSILLV